jgi:hypothetical protein
MLARPVVLDSSRNLSEAQGRERLHPVLGAALERLPSGHQVWRGLPFDAGLAGGGATRRWIAIDGPLRIALDADTDIDAPASHVVVAHLCDVWRDDAGQRPAAVPAGHVVPIGQPLARYTVVAHDGRRVERVVRRRFEVSDGILGWGSVAFASVTHLDNEPLDWRGPHERQTPGRYAPVGQSGALTVMPGKYGGNVVGVSDLVPSADDDAFLWLYAIPLGPDVVPVAMEVEPLAGGQPGSTVLLAAVTLFAGTDDPLRRGPRMVVRVDGIASAPAVDLGTVIRSLAPIESASPATPGAVGGVPAERPVGWGAARRDEAGEAAGGPRLVDIVAAADAVIDLGGWAVPASHLRPGEHVQGPGGRSVVLLPSQSIPVTVAVRDGGSGQLIPSRVRFTSRDGRYLPPDSHRDEVNPGLLEDSGADLILGSAAYAYVPGEFTVHLPPGPVEVEVVAGFERRPVHQTLVVTSDTRHLALALERSDDLRPEGWVTADGHVHFLSPSTALLQAAAEDVDLVHVLATQWADLFTGISDLPWGATSHRSGRPMVVMGTENRQNLLGHLALLGARHPTLPLASGGPPEGRIGGALDVLLADWAERCRADGGLVVGAHFPLPYAEIAADIVTGRIDALEAQALPPGLDDPMILEWYRYLRLGYRLPIVGGTDKMSAEVPVGAVRTYARLAPDVPLTFDTWAGAIRAGRTFVTSGPMLRFAVDGHEPGDTVRLSSPGRVGVRAVASASQPVISDLEIVLDGRVVAHVGAGSPTAELVLDQELVIETGGWLAARSRSPHHIESAFATSMAAHTSPVYLEVAGRPARPPEDDAAVVEQVILGARTWVADVAAVASAAERDRMTAFLDGALQSLEARLRASR